MVKKCFYPGCNYIQCQFDKRSLFLLPSNPERRQRLLDQLKLPVGLVINLSTFFICSEHFTEGSIVVSGGKVFLGENPTIKGCEHLRKFSDKVRTFPEFLVQYQTVVGDVIEAYGWKTLTGEDKSFICFYTDQFDVDKGLSIVKNAVINSDMSLRVIVLGKLEIKKVLNSWNELVTILSDESDSFDQQQSSKVVLETAASSLERLLLSPAVISDHDTSLKLKFLIDQLHNFCVKPSRRRYTLDTICAALMTKTMSNAAYDYLKNYLTLPSQYTLQKTSSQHDVMDNKKYFSALLKMVPTLSTKVAIYIDEMYTICSFPILSAIKRNKNHRLQVFY